MLFRQVSPNAALVSNNRTAHQAIADIKHGTLSGGDGADGSFGLKEQAPVFKSLYVAGYGL